MQLFLDERDAEALALALDSRLTDLARELSRTERRSMQHDLAQVLTRLETIAGRLRDLRQSQAPLVDASGR